MIDPQEAFKIIIEHARPLKAERKSLKHTLGYCLSETIRADRDMPPADRSAMDGYAVRVSDLKRCPCELSVVGEVAAGDAHQVKVSAGACVRILTGGNVPPGADAVVKVEQTQANNGRVKFLACPDTGENIRKRAEEFPKGRVLLAKGTVLDSARIGICATVGKDTVRVHRCPRITLFSTGKELQPVQNKVQSHQLRNSNGPTLFAALQAHGYKQIVQRIVPDDPNILARKLEAALIRQDMIILTGGVSVGKYDFVPEAVKSIRATIRFHGVAMKPGKPLLYATRGRNQHIFGLPGNPLSAMNGFYEFVLPALRLLSGIPAASCRTDWYLPLGQSYHPRRSRTEYILVRLHSTSKGPEMIPVPSCGSADLTAGAQADGVAIVPREKSKCPKGTVLEYRPWRNVL